MGNNNPLAWSVGDVTITSILEAEGPTSPKFLFDGVDREDVIARAAAAPWLAPHFVNEEGRLIQKVHCCIIDTGDHRIAVDTCVGNDKQRDNEAWHQLQGPFLEDLTEAGYPPESITEVVCTHLHVDHVGWNTRLVDGQWVPTFPNANYLFVRTEFDYWSETDDPFGDPVFSDSVAPIRDAGLASLVSPNHRVCGDIALQPTPGHTPGHVSVVIQSVGKRAIITGDMAHTPLQLADPMLSSKFDTDPDKARATRLEVFPGWADGETLVIGTHFGTPSAGIMVRDGNGYKLEID